MGHGYQDLVALLADVRRRWRTVTMLRMTMWAASGAAGVLAGALLAHWALQPQGLALVALWGAAAAAVLLLAGWVGASGRHAPRDLQIARFIEERCGDMEDSLVTAFDHARGDSAMSAAVVSDAVQRARQLDLDRVISRQSLQRAAMAAAVALMVCAIAGVVSTPQAGQAVRAAGLYLFPERLGLTVMPGDAKVPEGGSLRIVARLASGHGMRPVLRIGAGDEWRELTMDATADGFATTVERVDRDFRYLVAVAGTSSREYAVGMVRRPRVERIDLHYEYPSAFRMAPREEQDGGDVYGPAGTRVRITVHTNKAAATAVLNLAGGTSIPLTSRGDALDGELTIAEDGSYRVALADEDGLSNPGDTEYFIRTLQDGPPDVRITRPASDRQVTPLEEVSIEASADDDFGVASLDLVYAVAGGAEKVVPFHRNGSAISVMGERMLYLEDLRVRPGDVVAYYARARDISRGKRSSEARSDIFFLEVTPFDDEFVASQSQGTGGGGSSQALEDLIQAEKDIITATWNLDRRGRTAGARSPDDIRSVGRAQQDLRTRTEAMLGEMQRANDLRRRRQLAGRGAAPAAPDVMAEAIGRAVAAMANAREQLDALKTAGALPQEMTALNELLRAQAEVRRRDVQQQQASGQGGQGSNRRQQDMSSLFDRELARQQQTNYETPGRGETRNDQPQADDALQQIQELARRQDALARSEQELAKRGDAVPQEELKRELERLTREQSELRREAEELARSLQQSGQSKGGQGQQGQSGRGSRGGRGAPDEGRQQAGRDLQQASEDMQGATSELRRDNPQQASARASRAAERLRDLEQRMRGAQPDARRRALGELQLESRQLAESQRRLGEEANGRGGAGDQEDRARRQASEQGRLADRAERLEQSVRQLAGGGARDQREQSALKQAVQEVETQRVSERMRNAARQPGAGRESTEIARALEQLADRLGAAGGQSDASQQLSEDLSRIRRLREELASLDRQIAEMRNGRGNGNGNPGRGEQEGRGGEPGRGSQPGRGGQPGGTGQEGGAQQPWQEARELLNELRREDDAVVPPNADGFNPGRSAPGTEGWKQDFTKWDELKVQVAAALERAERTAADQLRQQQSRDRLNAGASQSVPEAYRLLVDKYYRALAGGRK